MAGGGIGPGTGKQYPGKLTLNVFMACIIAATGGLIFGYDLGISGGVTSMDSFLKKFFPAVYRKESSQKPTDNQYCTYNNEILTLFTSSLYLAALVSSAISSYVTRRCGRRTTMCGGGILFMIGGGLNGFAQKVWMLIVGRMFLGFGIGCINQSVPIYVSEMAPSKYRGAMNIMFQLSITLGILAANALNYFFSELPGSLSWRLGLGGAVVPAAIIILGSFVLTDTPNSMVERGKPEEAKARLLKIRGVADVDEEFNDLVEACEKAKKVEHPWSNILRRKYRPQLVFAIAIPFFQQFTGMNVFMFYAPVLFKTVGFGASAALMSSLITGCVNACATVVSILLVDRLGRRFLFFLGGAQMLICQILITIAFAFKFGWSGNPGVMPHWYSMALVILVCVYVSGFAWSWGPLGWLIPSEIFPLEIRSAAQSINVMVNMIFTFVIAQIFTFILCHIRFGMFLLFGFFVIGMSTFIYKLLPETKGIPIEEMHKVWMEHKYWRKFVVEEDECVEQGKAKGAE